MEKSFSRIGVKYFQRKPRPSGNFSLEFIFDDVRNRLKNEIDAELLVAPHYSNGLFRRLAICFHSWRHRARKQQVNHVTGDTTFSAIVLRKKRTVLTILDCGSFLEKRGIKRWLIKKIWFDWPMSQATIVTTISSSVRNELIRFTNCHPKKIRIVPVAVSESFSKKAKPFSHHPRILHLGIAPNKNLARLLQALQGVACTLVIIGKLDDKLMRLAQDCNINLESHFNLEWEEVIQMYGECDIVSFVSTYEGFGMPIVEANVVGRPVVTSNISSMPEVAGDSACLVDPFDVNSIRDGIQRVIDNTDYRELLVQKGYQNARRFHPDKIAQMYLSIYKKLSDQ